MFGELLTWSGVVAMAVVAWALYTFNPMHPRDEDGNDLDLADVWRDQYDAALEPVREESSSTRVA